MGDAAEMDMYARASSNFCDFMAQVAMFEEFTKLGIQFLKGFQQELEFFRRDLLHKASKVVERIIEENKTDRMMAYAKAGYRHTHSAARAAENLFSYQQGLQLHINKVKALMDKIEVTIDIAISIMREANRSSTLPLNATANGPLEMLTFEEKGAYEDISSSDEADFLLCKFEEITNLSIVIIVIHNMLKLEFAMQEKIVLSLNTNSSSGELETYCMLWDLRPYVDDQIIHQSWALVK